MAESPISNALKALDQLRSIVSWTRSTAAGHPPFAPVPTLSDLEEALAILHSDDDASLAAPVQRWALYNVVRAGYASELLGPRLRGVVNKDGQALGEPLFRWMRGRLQLYSVPPASLESLHPDGAVEWLTRCIRVHLAQNGIASCDPENGMLEACRGRPADDTDYVSTVKVAADFPRTIDQLDVIYDPRHWDANPYTNYFDDVHFVTDIDGKTTDNRHDPTGYIYEHVTDGGGLYLINTLFVEWARTPSLLLIKFRLGQTLGSSGNETLERDFGHFIAEPVIGRSGWSRISVEKNIRFNTAAGSAGGDIGWGDLANLIAPVLVAKWLTDMCHGACWEVPSGP